MTGLGANLGRDLRECKKSLLESIQMLDHQEDASGLSPDEWLLRYALEEELMGIFANEECYWRVRGTQKWVLKGDANTTYFQAIANGRRRRNTIPLLWDGDRLLQDPDEIWFHVDGFYKDLFSPSPRGGTSLDPSIWTGP